MKEGFIKLIPVHESDMNEFELRADSTDHGGRYQSKDHCTRTRRELWESVLERKFQSHAGFRGTCYTHASLRMFDTHTLRSKFREHAYLAHLYAGLETLYIQLWSLENCEKCICGFGSKFMLQASRETQMYVLSQTSDMLLKTTHQTERGKALLRTQTFFSGTYRPTLVLKWSYDWLTT